MSKRKNDGEINEGSKQQKSNDVDSNGPASVDDQIQEMSPDIFKLNAICCDDLFEWLSLEDLHSLGQTCKRMHRLTGHYFKENFNQWFVYKDQSIFYGELQLNGFIQFAASLQLRKGNKADFQYIGANCDSLRHIKFHEFELTKALIDCIKVKLDQIEIINFHRTSLNLYEDFLKFCPNLRILRVFGFEESEWMCYKYPKLEHLELHFAQNNSCPNIGRFFQENPHLKIFKTDQCILLTNKDIIMNSEMKLDVLNVVSYNSDDTLHTVLNTLYNRGFYKWLKLGGVFHDTAELQKYQIDTLLGLEQLYGYFQENVAFPKTIGLKEIGIDSKMKYVDLEKMAVSFPNLRKVHLSAASIDELLLFIRRLPQLKELSTEHFEPRYLQLDLSILNKERKRLPGACKVNIYVSEKVYLETKVATGNIYANHDSIEIKRGNCIYPWM